MGKSITLYGIDDDYGRGTPQVVLVQAIEHKKIYQVVWGETKEFIRYKQRIGKHSSLVSLSPREALLKYLCQQNKIIERGREAERRRAETKKLLKISLHGTDEEKKCLQNKS